MHEFVSVAFTIEEFKQIDSINIVIVMYCPHKLTKTTHTRTYKQKNKKGKLNCEPRKLRSKQVKKSPKNSGKLQFVELSAG